MSVYAQEYGFGAGALWGTRTDIAGQTPRRFGTLQDVTIAFTGEIKELYGANEYAIALARGKTKIEVSPKFAQLSGPLFNDMFFGGTLGVGQTLVADGESVTPATGSFTVANGASFLADLGLFYAGSGQQLKVTTSATPATVGSYNPGAGGVYKTATGDTIAMSVSYSYTETLTGNTMSITNPKMGTTPTFSMVFEGSFDGREAVFTFTNCVSGSLNMPTKQDDWQIVDMKIQVSANAAGLIGTVNFGN